MAINQQNFNFGSGKQTEFVSVTGRTDFNYSGPLGGFVFVPEGFRVKISGNLYKHSDGSWYTDGNYELVLK